MNILSIGNSFSTDAQRYLNKIALSDGVTLNTFNLYIGGCTISTHYRNMLKDVAAYDLEMNGVATGFKVSLKEALLNRSWDVVTIQQGSHESTNYDNFQPYLDELVKFVRHCVPKAKIALHQTWAYEEGSPRLVDRMGYSNQLQMFSDLKDAYGKAFSDMKGDILIPSGELFQRLLKNGIEKVHRDTYHASLGLGRYALGLLWYSVLTGKDVEYNTFADFDEEVNAEDIKTVKRCIKELL